MQCENGYVKPGVRGILCRKAEEPKDGDLKSIAHALCGHQRFCPNSRCYLMLPGWENCTKRSVEREENAGEDLPVAKGKRTAKKKSPEKGSGGE